MNDSEIFFLKQRVSELEWSHQQLLQRMNSITLGEGEPVCKNNKTFTDAFQRMPATSERCAKCGVPTESYQAYACEDPQCSRPRPKL